MRFQKRTDRPVGADGTAPCDLCEQAVAIGPEGYCSLGHRVTTPEMAAPVPAAASPEASSGEPVAVAAVSIADVTASAAPESLATSESRVGGPVLEGFDDLLDFEDLDRRSA